MPEMKHINSKIKWQFFLHFYSIHKEHNILVILPLSLSLSSLSMYAMFVIGLFVAITVVKTKKARVLSSETLQDFSG